MFEGRESGNNAVYQFPEVSLWNPEVPQKRKQLWGLVHRGHPQPFTPPPTQQALVLLPQLPGIAEGGGTRMPNPAPLWVSGKRGNLNQTSRTGYINI